MTCLASQSLSQRLGSEEKGGAEDAELRLHGIGLDFYHLSENVHKARRRVYGEENEAGQAWASQILHAFKHDGYERAYEELTTWQAGMRGGKPPPRKGPAIYSGPPGK